MTTVIDEPVDTGREVTVLTAQGLTARQIADALGISQRTVNRWRAKHRTLDGDLPTAWKSAAACRSADVDAEWFVPAEDGLTHYARGRAVCMRCPVRDACLTDAMSREGNAAAEDRAGLWGGLSPVQRAGLAWVRRKRTKPVKPRRAEIQERHREELLAGLREGA